MRTERLRTEAPAVVAGATTRIPFCLARRYLQRLGFLHELRPLDCALDLKALALLTRDVMRLEFCRCSLLARATVHCSIPLIAWQTRLAEVVVARVVRGHPLLTFLHP